MFRTAVGALDAMLGGSALSKKITRDVVGRQLWARRISTKTTAVPLHQTACAPQFWAHKLPKTKAGSATAGKFRNPFFSARRPFHSSKTRRSETNSTKEKTPEPEPAPTTLGAKLKRLSREYGWSAVGVYMTLSILDFPFCFLLVRTVGTDRIAQAEHVVVSNVEKAIPERVKAFWREYKQALKEARAESGGELAEAIEMAGYGVKEAEERNEQGASLATQLALAYAIHKSFIFIRVPLTAAILPKVVKVLRSWGWQIGKRRSKVVK
ncbi:hypothetical protein B0H63DRAFT_314433 [Podospora didyma]|uniref:DUF1279 domain-containing protein n=1 Tax=Podospora didyma TaxID=330526 RepID=A0AAE0N4W9_9PEZI|nr:hypothetical protein B0H63DRAFT_314433 [Podospora didyma]